MFDQEAGIFAIVAVPHLPVGQVILLRRLVDQLMTYSPGNEGFGGMGHEKIVARATGLVRHRRTGGGVKRHGAADGRGASASVTDRGDSAGDREHNGPDLAGGRQ
jgi:hypothetical protein